MPQETTSQDLLFSVDTEVERLLQLLRRHMREKRFSQVAVQERLGWKGSYLSQLFNRTKALRVEQVLAILGVIEVEPRAFFQEVFGGLEVETREYVYGERWLGFLAESLREICEREQHHQPSESAKEFSETDR